MWYVSLFGLSVLLGWLAFRRFKRKNKQAEVTPEPTFTAAKKLHGHNLDKWHYLGYVELKFNEEEYPVFLFADKDDLTQRSYTITKDTHGYCRKYHTYVTKYLEPWSTGEFEIYTLCRSPSRWLKEYMLEKFGYEWDNEADWWKSTNASKYKSAQKKQTKTPPNQGSGAKKDPVVIKVEFGKKDNAS